MTLGAATCRAVAHCGVSCHGALPPVVLPLVLWVTVAISGC